MQWDLLRVILVELDMIWEIDIYKNYFISKWYMARPVFDELSYTSEWL